MLSTAIVASAAYEIEEEYISDLRLVYADTYKEAVQSFADSKLEGYKVLNHNLNEYSGKKAVWLAYKVTTNINDAITNSHHGIHVVGIDDGSHIIFGSDVMN